MGVNLARRAARAMLKARISLVRKNRQSPIKTFEGGESRMDSRAGLGVDSRS